MVPSSGHYLLWDQGLLGHSPPSECCSPVTGVAVTLSWVYLFLGWGWGGVFSVMVLNAFPKRTRKEMDAGRPALKLAHLPAGQVLWREERTLLRLVCAHYHTIVTALPVWDYWQGPNDSVQQVARAVLNKVPLDKDLFGARMHWGRGESAGSLALVYTHLGCDGCWAGQPGHRGIPCSLRLVIDSALIGQSTSDSL